MFWEIVFALVVAYLIIGVILGLLSIEPINEFLQIVLGLVVVVGGGLIGIALILAVPWIFFTIVRTGHW